MACNQVPTIPMKTGDTVRLTAIFKNGDDTPRSLEGYRIDVDFIHPRWGNVLLSTDSQSKHGKIVIHEEGEDSIGEYTIHAGDSSEWPEGAIPVDILYSKNGDKIHTEDFSLTFTKGRSRIINER